MDSSITWYGDNLQYIKVIVEYRDTPLKEKVVNKALMIAMNYLIENMKTEEEEPE